MGCTPKGFFEFDTCLGRTPNGFVELTGVGCISIGNCTPKYHPDQIFYLFYVLPGNPDRIWCTPTGLESTPTGRECTPSSIWTPVGAVMKGVQWIGFRCTRTMFLNQCESKPNFGPICNRTVSFRQVVIRTPVPSKKFQ